MSSSISSRAEGTRRKDSPVSSFCYALNHLTPIRVFDISGLVKFSWCKVLTVWRKHVRSAFYKYTLITSRVGLSVYINFKQKRFKTCLKFPQTKIEQAGNGPSRRHI